MSDFKRYIVFIDYGSEGWKIFLQSDSFEEAISARDTALSQGNTTVKILRDVRWTCLEERNP